MRSISGSWQPNLQSDSSTEGQRGYYDLEPAAVHRLQNVMIDQLQALVLDDTAIAEIMKHDECLKATMIKDPTNGALPQSLSLLGDVFF